MKKEFYSVLIVFLAICFLSTCFVTANASDKIYIGAVAPMTGKYAEMGNDILNAARMAVEERNAAGGIGGKEIVIREEDDRASPKDAVSVAHRFAGDKSVIGVVGPLNSGAALPSSPIYAYANLALIMPVPTNPDITKQGFTNLYRIPITDDLQGSACLDFMLSKLNKTRIAIVHNKAAYGEGIATEVKKALGKKGFKPVCFDGINPDDQDYRATITRLKKRNPEAIFFGGGYAEAALFIKQSKELGINAPFVMGDGCFNTQLIRIAGNAAERSIVSNIAPITAPTKKAKVFYDKFESKYGKIVAFAPLGYVATNILLDAIDKAKAKTREGVLQVLQDPGYKYDSILGEFVFAPNGDSKGHKIFFHIIEDGKFRALF